VTATQVRRNTADIGATAVNTALNQAFDDVEALLLSRPGEATLEAPSADCHGRLVAGSHDQASVHAW
jgi:hypothetical protein